MRIAAVLLVAISPGASDLALAAEQPKEVLLLARIKRQAARDLSRLPSFTCLASFNRASGDRVDKPLTRVDRVRAEIAYIDGHEQFAWPGSPDFEATSLARIVGNGLASTGEFIAHARTVFMADTGTITYGGEEECAGKPAVRYDYRVSSLFSGFDVSVPQGHAAIGMRGSFWAERDSLDLLRLTVEGDEIPARLGVRSVDIDIDYRRMRIGPGAPVLMPQSAISILTYDSGKVSRNDAEFTHCREYSSESRLSFEPPTPEMRPESPSAATPAEFVLPTGLLVTTRLMTRIDSSAASVGDPISAVVDGDVRKKGVVVVPSGAVLTGRIRILQRDSPDRYLVGLEFTDLTLAAGHARFVADIEEIDPMGGVLKIEYDAQSRKPSLTTTINTRETILPPQLPGVATFFVLKKDHFKIEPGLRIKWWITSVKPKRR